MDSRWVLKIDDIGLDHLPKTNTTTDSDNDKSTYVYYFRFWYKCKQKAGTF